MTYLDSLWESRFYDLRSWEEGYCYTYNPPKLSEAGTNEGMALFFNKIDKGIFQNFAIYLHEKGQFWPGKEFTALGQSDKIILEGDLEISRKFCVH